MNRDELAEIFDEINERDAEEYEQLYQEMEKKGEFRKKIVLWTHRILLKLRLLERK